MYLEVLIKSTEVSIVVPTVTSSLYVSESVDRLNHALAPLASSETFSDVGSLYCDELPPQKDVSTNGISNAEKKSRAKMRNNDFDSLEILFDFPSAELSNESETPVPQQPEHASRIRFSEHTQIINATKVIKKVRLNFFINQKIFSRTNQNLFELYQVIVHQYKNNEHDLILNRIKQHHRIFFGFVRYWQTNFYLNFFSFSAKRLSDVLSSPRQSIRNAAEGSLKKVLPGVVVTSSRSSRRRISSAAATQAFAVATSGESPKGIRTERIASHTGKFSPKKL